MCDRTTVPTVQFRGKWMIKIPSTIKLDKAIGQHNILNKANDIQSEKKARATS